MDMWSVGCCFHEILCLHPLFPGQNEIDQVAKIHDVCGTPSKQVLDKFKHRNHAIDFNFPPKSGTGIEKLLPHVSLQAIELIYRLCEYDWDVRITAKQALSQAYFRELRDQEKRRQSRADGILVGNGRHSSVSEHSEARNSQKLAIPASHVMNTGNVDMAGVKGSQGKIQKPPTIKDISLGSKNRTQLPKISKGQGLMKNAEREMSNQKKTYNKYPYYPRNSIKAGGQQAPIKPKPKAGGYMFPQPKMSNKIPVSGANSHKYGPTLPAFKSNSKYSSQQPLQQVPYKPNYLSSSKKFKGSSIISNNNSKIQQSNNNNESKQQSSSTSNTASGQIVPNGNFNASPYQNSYHLPKIKNSKTKQHKHS